MISAIMPTFNRAKFLPARFKELAAQTYKDFEIVIVDDGSTDDTEEVVYLLGEQYKNELAVSYIKLPQNSGMVSIPRAIGINQCKGLFIAHTDDDILDYPNKFEDLMAGFTDERIVLTYGDRHTIWSRNIGYTEFNTTPNWDPLKKWGVDGSQFLYRKSCYEKIPYIICRRACDWELAKKLKTIGEFKHVNKTVSLYEWHGGNRSLNDSTKTMRIDLKPFLHMLPKNIEVV